MAADNMSSVHVSPDVLSTLLLLQQGKLYKLQQKIMNDIFRSIRPEVICKKAALKTTQNLQENACVGVCFNKIAGLQTCSFIKKRLQYRCFYVILRNF